LQTWVEVEKARFCEEQCSNDICGFDKYYELKSLKNIEKRKKRQIRVENANTNISESTISNSLFLESKKYIKFLYL
jgi:hypothetical protein